MTSSEEIIDCVLSVDEVLEEAEEYLQEKNYDHAMHKIKEAREMIDELRSDDDESNNRQEVDMHVAKILK